jgi:hypothetical protein
MAHVSKRQTACIRCARGKRRCDAEKPKCGRCSRFQLDCRYSDRVDLVSGSSRGSIETSVQHYADAGFRSISTQNTFSHAKRMPTDRLIYCATRLRDCPGDLVRTGQTLFIKVLPHVGPLLKPLSDAYAACAVYCCRSPQNSDLARLVLVEKYRELLDAPVLGDLNFELAQAQAVLMVHIALLFDSDEVLRKEAESGLDKVRARVLRLQRDAEGKVNCYEVPTRYDHWLLAENIRRTIFAATFVEAIYLALREGYCVTLPFMELLPITVSEKLWPANDEFEWRSLQSPSTAGARPYLDAVETWKESTPYSALDGLQQLLYAACKGIPPTGLEYMKQAETRYSPPNDVFMAF